MTIAAHDIGARLRHAREQRGLTLRDLANKTETEAEPPPPQGMLAGFRDRWLGAHPALAWLAGRRQGTVPP